MNRRRFLGTAAAAGAASLLVSETTAAAINSAAPAKLRPGTTPPRTHAERFAKRIDLIRQSLDVPGISAAVLHQQSLLMARGFGFVDLAAGTKATENTPYPMVPDRQLTLILLASSERASSVFSLGAGDPLRSAFVTAFLDEFGHVQ
jgi:CubicO group peptidase (beta-lactamase class C family)